MIVTPSVNTWIQIWIAQYLHYLRVTLSDDYCTSTLAKSKARHWPHCAPRKLFSWVDGGREEAEEEDLSTNIWVTVFLVARIWRREGERGRERERKGESKREIQRSETKGRGKEELSHKNPVRGTRSLWIVLGLVIKKDHEINFSTDKFYPRHNLQCLNPTLSWFVHNWNTPTHMHFVVHKYQLGFFWKL